MTFKPLAHKGAWINLGLAVLVLGLSAWVGQMLPSQVISGQLFWLALLSLGLLLVGLYLLYRTVALFTLRYILDRNGLIIRFGPSTYYLPMADIGDVLLADHIVLPQRGWQQFHLPIWWPGKWREVQFFATAPAEASVLVKTGQYNWLISPQNRAEFIRAWALRQELGATQTWESGVQRWRFFGWPIWFDKLTWRLGGGALLLGLFVLGATCSAYPNWPSNVSLNLQVVNIPAITLLRDQLLLLPAGGVLILFVNLLLGGVWYKREKMLAYTAWGIAMLLQLAVWIGLRLVTGA